MTDESSTHEALASVPEGSTALERRPVIDLMPRQSLELLRSRINAASKVAVSDGELGAFLEICHAYQLDPLTGECWLVKSGETKVLLMVGRDGLRKIAHNSGLRVYCDVIYEQDEFRVSVTSEGGHSVAQGYSHPKDRGEVVGAWAQVLDTRGSERGFFVATMDEYKPTSPEKLKYSPWGSQTSVMILAAAERQALRQATPLAGLVAQGELDRGEDVAAGYTLSTEEEQANLESLAQSFPPGTCAMILGVVQRARALGHANLADVGTIELSLRDQPAEFAEQWCRDADEELDAFEKREQPPEAEVVLDPPVHSDAWPTPDQARCGVPDPSRQNKACVLSIGHHGPHYADEATWDAFSDDATIKAQRLRDEANELLDQAQALRDAAMEADSLGANDSEADSLEDEADRKRAEADRIAPPQETLGGGL